MKKLFLLSLIALSSPAVVIASTNNIQTFTLLDVDGGDTTTVTIQERIVGEASPYPEGDFTKYIITLFPNDSSFEKVERYTKRDSATWDANDIIALDKSEEMYHLPGGGAFILPPIDTLFPDRHEEIAASSGPEFWYQNCKADCLRDLRFIGVTAKRLYFNRKGLYINYNIKEAYYHVSTGLLIVFTDQPRLAAGLDTMHGVLLYRVTH